MKQLAKILLIVLVLTGVGFFVFQTMPEQSNNNTQGIDQKASMDSQQIDAASSTKVDDPKISEQPGNYQAYSPEALAASSGTKILFFHAPWCSQCRQLDSDITASGVPNGITIFKVDYDNNQALRKQYGVTLQTTFVVLNADGSLKQRHVAYDEPTFNAVKKALL